MIHVYTAKGTYFGPHGNTIVLDFPKNMWFINKVSALPRREYISTSKVWLIPIFDIPVLIDAVGRDSLNIDKDVLERLASLTRRIPAEERLKDICSGQSIL